MMGLIVAPGAIANVYFRYFYVRDTFSAGPQQLNDLGNVSQEFVLSPHDTATWTLCYK